MPSVIADEIASQGPTLATFLDAEMERVRVMVSDLPPFSHVVLAARGTSANAGTYARYLWGHLAGLAVAPASPSLHTLYGTPPRFEGALVVGISQSGQSPDTREVILEAKRQGRPTLVITNDPDSPLANAADRLLPMHAYPERSIAATKTYTATLGAIALLGAAWSGQSERLRELRELPAAMTTTLAMAAQPAHQLAAQLRQRSTVIAVGRGFNLASAEESALKIRELTGLSTLAFSAAEFRHGHIAIVNDAVDVLLVRPRGRAFDDVGRLIDDVAARGGRVTIVSDDDSRGWHRLLTVSVPEWLSPLVSILPVQLLAVDLATQLGLDPDHPHGLPEKIIKTT